MVNAKRKSMVKITEVIGSDPYNVSVAVMKDNDGYWIHFHSDYESDNPSVHIDHDDFITFIKEIYQKEMVKVE